MEKVIGWLAASKLSLNVIKTKYMLSHFRQRTLWDCDIPKTRISEIGIERVDKFHHLWLTINKNRFGILTPDKISNNISLVVEIMNRLKHVLPQSSLNLCMILHQIAISNFVPQPRNTSLTGSLKLKKEPCELYEEQTHRRSHCWRDVAYERLKTNLN